MPQVDRSSDAPTPPASAPDRVHRHLKERILSGELAGGEMTSEGEIAAALGVSRTPVREALLRLQAESLVRIYPKRGVLVVPIAPGEADDVFDARLLVESHAAARLAAGPDAALARLTERLEEILTDQQEAVDAGDLEAYTALDADFHQEVIEAGGNVLLSGFARGLRERQRRLTARGVRRDADRAMVFVRGHRALLGHLRGRDAAAYARELDTHLDQVRRSEA